MSSDDTKYNGSYDVAKFAELLLELETKNVEFIDKMSESLRKIIWSLVIQKNINKTVKESLRQVPESLDWLLQLRRQ